MKPTVEQDVILEAFPKHGTVKINACAGAGKTTTLRLVSEACILPSLYVCFNKANAVEATQKFPAHVTCRTLHSLAYSEFGRKLAHKLSTARVAGEGYVNKARTNSEIAKLYNVPSITTSDVTKVTARATAGHIKATVARYQNSAHEQIDFCHLPKHDLKKLAKLHPQLELEKYFQIIINFAKMLWADRINVDSPVQADHDTYLKLWQLSKPKLPYEVIYVDEAQDTNPVCFDVLKNQTHAKMVYVGDSFQSIYGFRSAVNAMDVIEAPTFVLSKSFRYGQTIADLATFIIRDGIQVKGLESINSRLGFVNSRQYTKIYRTNSALVEDAVALTLEGTKVYCNIDTNKYEKQLKSAQALFEGKLDEVKDDDISLYSSWEEFCETFEENPEYKRIAGVVENNQTGRFLVALKRIKENSKSYDVLLTTAHKSKGMEWDNVVISDDFNHKHIFAMNADQQEINLFYVACTRAIKNLQLPPNIYGIVMSGEYLESQDSTFERSQRNSGVSV